MKLEGGTTTSLFNQFAAVPSLHVGFAFAIGIALAAAVRNPILRYAALMWGPVMLLTVVATGNHFVFDAIAGVSITAPGYGVHRLIAAGWPARRRVDAYALGACPSMEPAAALA
jgi:membrane-associated phospholipid phosphatase